MEPSLWILCFDCSNVLQKEQLGCKSLCLVNKIGGFSQFQGILRVGVATITL